MPIDVTTNEHKRPLLTGVMVDVSTVLGVGD